MSTHWNRCGEVHKLFAKKVDLVAEKTNASGAPRTGLRDVVSEHLTCESFRKHVLHVLAATYSTVQAKFVNKTLEISALNDFRTSIAIFHTLRQKY